MSKFIKNLFRVAIFTNVLFAMYFVMVIANNGSLGDIVCYGILLIAVTINNCGAISTLSIDELNEVLCLNFFKKIGCDFSEE